MYESLIRWHWHDSISHVAEVEQDAVVRFRFDYYLISGWKVPVAVFLHLLFQFGQVFRRSEELSSRLCAGGIDAGEDYCAVLLIGRAFAGHDGDQAEGLHRAGF